MSEEISPDIIKNTQKLLGKYVKKPPLTDKLLKKPPFRFLHDIINTVIKETGFLKDVFSKEELISENVKEKDAKIDFLNKLINVVKFVTKIDLAVRSNKIVAGLEPTKTNLLLQAIGKAIDAKSDTAEYVSQLNSGRTDTGEKKKVKKPSTLREDKTKNNLKSKNNKTEISKAGKSKKTVDNSPKDKVGITPKDSSRNKIKEEKGKSVRKEVIQENNELTQKETAVELKTLNKCIKSDATDSNIENQIHLNADQKTNNTFNNDANEDIKVTENVSVAPKLEIKDTDVKEELNTESTDNSKITTVNNLSRPKSARPKSGDKKTLKHIDQYSNNIEVEKPIINHLEMTVNQAPQRPKSSLRPPSVRPSSARPGAPRLRPDSALPLYETVTMGNINVIVENVDNADDEETVIIQTSELADENILAVDVPDDNKGQLVEQILEQIQEEGESFKKKTEIDWEQMVLNSKDGVTKEIIQLRSLIQSLTRTANPLGKLMNYLHEDIDAMQGELQIWSNTKNQLFSEIHKQKRHTAESNKPLLIHLEQLQDDIKKKEQEILNIRCNILKNELRIKELLNI